MNEITINSTTLPIKEYNGQRVVTFKDIDAVHGRPEGTAHRSFKNNRKRFIEGTDYFRRNSSEAKKEFGIIAPNGLILVTESGYLMLVKSFTDDLAWDVQRQLVNCYFRVKQPEYEQLTLEPLDNGYDYFQKTFDGIPVITLEDFTHLTGISRDTAHYQMKRICVPNKEYFLLQGSALARYKLENSRASRFSRCLLVLTPAGARKLERYYGKSGLLSQKLESKTAIQEPPRQNPRVDALKTLREAVDAAIEALSK